MSTLMPQAMEKKETMEGSAFTREEASEAPYSTDWTLARGLRGWPPLRVRKGAEFRRSENTR
jgi:hypothetical protein